MIPDKATEAQNRASEPLSSTWLAANAGSGKTKVLTDRVARLLLAGVSPQNILCLTYTKAAASEMQNRLFRLLGEWAMMPDDDLRTALARLGDTPQDDLAPARRLFARAIETPGGLKIQTIHSFCAGLLRRFPLEAGVSPGFVEMDERNAIILREEVIEEMAMGRARAALDGLARHFTGADLGALTEEIAGNRTFFASDIDEADIWRWMGLPPGLSDADIARQTLAPGDDALVREIRTILAASDKSTDQKVAALLAGWRDDLPDDEHLRLLQEAFLRKKDGLSKFGRFPTKGVQTAHPDLMPGLEALMQRVETSLDLQKRLYSAQKTLALHRFARPFLHLYEARKAERGWLDFDDLIIKTGELLSDPTRAGWVLYRLDGRIDHILVDEAQDTSPEQWKVIELLTQEFTSGEGARDVDRTIFVVGDLKQSIYSFQGAEPGAFSRMKAAFAERLKNVGQMLQDLRLEYSFRSSRAVLEVVDHALIGRPGLDEDFRHMAFFDKPGRVDLWPPVAGGDKPPEPDWTDPSDITQPETDILQLARLVAQDIDRMLREETLPERDGTPRPVEPRDILILVRGRKNGLFEALIRACKAQGLPIAGADLLRLGAELAVNDLTALLQFLATPEDDLSLAAALRSPLLGLDEADLYALAQPRPKGVYLWQALRAARERHPQVLEILDDLRAQADFLRPYELLERILTRHRGRALLLARLGHEAEEGIDALLGQALVYEQTQTPSLTGFLEWMNAMEVEVKRQIDNAGNQIRVMTVHGAKGLEAPIVILPDTHKRTLKGQDQLVAMDGAGMIWKPYKEQMPPPVARASDAAREARALEDMRLLYVAATRAANWLIVAAAGDPGEGDDSWHSILAQGLERAGAVAHDFPPGEGLRHEIGAWPAGQEAGKQAPPPGTSLPDWAQTPAPAPEPAPKPLSPSDLGGEKALPGEAARLDPEAAMRRGRMIHLLLEILPNHPPEAWPELGKALLTQGPDHATPDEATALVNEVAALLSRPDLAHVFAPDTLAEVDISAHLPELGGTRLEGIIDRLIVTPERVHVIDYKTNAVVPDSVQDTPQGILRQMGAYILALRQVFPGHQVECSILWTTKGNLMPVPPALAIAALAPP